MDTVAALEPNKRERELGVIAGRAWLAEFEPGKAAVVVLLETETTVLYGSWTSEKGRRSSPADLLRLARRNALNGAARLRTTFVKEAARG